MLGLSTTRLLAAVTVAVALSAPTPATAAEPHAVAPSCIGYFPAGNFRWDIGPAILDAGPYAALFCQEEGTVICYVQTAMGSAVIRLAGWEWTVAGDVLGLTFYGDQTDTPRPTCGPGGSVPVVDFVAWSPPRTQTFRIVGHGSG